MATGPAPPPLFSRHSRTAASFTTRVPVSPFFPAVLELFRESATKLDFFFLSSCGRGRRSMTSFPSFRQYLRRWIHRDDLFSFSPLPLSSLLYGLGRKRRMGIIWAFFSEIPFFSPFPSLLLKNRGRRGEEDRPIFSSSSPLPLPPPGKGTEIKQEVGPQFFPPRHRNEERRPLSPPSFPPSLLAYRRRREFEDYDPLPFPLSPPLPPPFPLSQCGEKPTT